jgi:DNA-binding transcriptional regulator YiaG
MEGRRENYRYTECGLDSVTLVDVIVFHCKCGAIVPEIPAVARLHEAIAITLLRKDSLLSGEEIRFLRKMAEYSATKLAAVMGVTKEVMSRWENNKQNIGKESDRFLRFVCFDGIVRTVTEKLSDDESGQSRLLELAKRMVSLNLPDALQKIEDEMNGSKAIKVNPEMLAQFGSDCSLLSSSVEELVIQ